MKDQGCRDGRSVSAGLSVLSHASRRNTIEYLDHRDEARSLDELSAHIAGESNQESTRARLYHTDLAVLRDAGLIEFEDPDAIWLTETGSKLAGLLSSLEESPTFEALLAILSTGQQAPSRDRNEFVPDREQVSHYLRACEGFTWQSNVALELDWSETKTSRTLSRMEDEGLITRYRIGRQNVVCLPEREPQLLQSVEYGRADSPVDSNGVPSHGT